MCPAHSVSPFCFWIWQSLGYPSNFKRAGLHKRVLSIKIIVRKGGTQKRNKCNRGLGLCLSFNLESLEAAVRGGRVPWTSPHALLFCLPLPGGLFPTVVLFGLQISQTSTFLSTGVEQLHTSCQFLTLQTRTSSEGCKKQAKGTRLSHWRLHWESFPALLIFSLLGSRKSTPVTSPNSPSTKWQRLSMCLSSSPPGTIHPEGCKSNNPPLHWCAERVTSPCQRVSPSWLPHRGCPSTHISNNHQEVQKQAEPRLMAAVTGGCHNWPRHDFRSWGTTG